MLNRSLTCLLCAIFLIAMHVDGLAQDCETYDAYGVVTDAAGKAIPGARAEFLDVPGKEPVKPHASPNAGYDLVQNTATGSDGRYVLNILGLPNIQNGQDFIFRVSAPGFIAYEEKVNIYLCGFERNIKLVRSKPPGKKKSLKKPRRRKP